MICKACKENGATKMIGSKVYCYECWNELKYGVISSYKHYTFVKKYRPTEKQRWPEEEKVKTRGVKRMTYTPEQIERINKMIKDTVAATK